MTDLIISGGPVMVPIGLASVIGLAVLLERIWALRASAVVPQSFVVEVDELMRQARWGDVIAAARKSNSAAGRVLLAAADVRHKSRAAVKERLEEVGRREAAELERFSSVLGTIASIAPLLGLLGTVWGMILTFDVIQTEGIGVVANLAGGISQALISTMAGLTVGIPALVAHRWVLARADRHVLALEDLGLLALMHLDAGGSEA
ncbi:MAG: MotA/TolQ/ExbB proton channel family protein [Myxococcota bacterium]|nr:MotA/TolQ/ExbB proton channel family protein [Myxococcota bacterium]MEC9390229.1 MotA/TolQ/ExbB proton channel family protein [Myxococcota bacterium]